MKDTNYNQDIKDFIEKESKRYALANTYQLDNPYLTKAEKIEVEYWFQFPDIMLLISFCAISLYSIYSPISLGYIICIPLLIDLISGIINWAIDLRKILKLFFLTLGHNLVLWALTLTTMGILLYNGQYVLAIIVFLCKILLVSLISPSMFLYTFLSKKYKMHAKWVYFKRFYAYEFPFEKEVEKPK